MYKLVLDWPVLLSRGMIFLLPSVAATVKSSASAIFIVLSIVGLLSINYKELRLEVWEKRLALLFVLLIAAALLSFINTDDVHKSLSRTERLARFLFFLPIYLLFKKDREAWPYFIWGLALASLILFITAYVSEGRAEGAYNSILFGDYAVAVSIFLFTFALFSEISLSQRIAFVTLALLAGYAVIASLTRGALFAYITFLFVAVIYFKLVRNGQLITIKSIASITIIVFIGTALLLQNENIISRLNQTLDEVLTFDITQTRPDFLSYRLAMWMDSYEIWKRNPIIGTGLGDFFSEMQTMVADGSSKTTMVFSEGHSVYFEFLATTGIIGVSVMLLAVFLVPLWLFIRAIFIDPINNLDASVMGVMLITSFMVFGISQNWLARSSITSFYVVLLVFFLAQLSFKSSTKE